jgi:hypothetical protein
MAKAVQTNKWQIFRQTVLDRRLYGPKFVSTTLFPLITVLLVQFFVEFFLSNQFPVQYIIYCVVLFFLVIISAFFSKNMLGKIEEFNPIGSKSSLALVFLSSISIFFSFTFKQGDALNYMIIDGIVFASAQVTLTYGIVNIVVIGHRASVIDKMNLKNNFFKKAAERWKIEINDLPEIEKILENLNQGKYVTQFYERGSFDLVILWSCSMMSNIINSATEPIIAKFPEKKMLFRQLRVNKAYEEFIDFERCPIQLSHLGLDSTNSKFNLQNIWKVRNDIAHRNIKPTFSQTIETLEVLVTFTNDMPKLVKAQLSQEVIV